MADDFERPTFTEIQANVESDIDARLDGTDPRLRRSVLNTIAYVVAGLAHSLYGFIDFVSKQIFVDTATSTYLDRHGVIWGVERLQAVQAKGNVTFTGTNGTLIPAGTELQRSDLALYTTDVDGTIATGTATVAVTAEDPGENGNTEAGSEFTFVAPITNVDSIATVAVGGLEGGLDIEDDDSYLERILLKIQQPPQGGSETDYKIWALESNNAVTNVWVYPLEDGPGTVTVRFMAYGSTETGVPDSELIDIVQEYIDTKKPVTATVNVEAPTTQTLNFTFTSITILPGYVLADVKDAVEANLADMLRRDAAPGATIYKNKIIENVLATPGVDNAVITVPAGDTASDPGEITIMGTVTWP